jgi:hypothetical protein
MDAEKWSEEHSHAGSNDDTAGMHSLGRRALLIFGAVAGADMAMGVSEPAMSQTVNGERLARANQQADRIINIHTHFVPGFYREVLFDVGLSTPDGIRAMPKGTSNRRSGLRTGWVSRLRSSRFHRPVFISATPQRRVCLAGA